MNIICWLQGIWRTISTPGLFVDGTPIDGCDYVDIEEHENVKVTVSKCEVCGKIDISWEKFFHATSGITNKEAEDLVAEVESEIKLK